IVEMVRAGGIISASGKKIPTRIDTVCLHGDGPEAIAIARSVRSSLELAGIEVKKF
ncbi:MAG TPA: LamB/YcsF family protein, partial [Alphaproteobacteria bacterium]|nr:LamB/YcsF family protein [Alphaproteobacteria bacterium]